MGGHHHIDDRRLFLRKFLRRSHPQSTSNCLTHVIVIGNLHEYDDCFFFFCYTLLPYSHSIHMHNMLISLSWYACNIMSRPYNHRGWNNLYRGTCSWIIIIRFIIARATCFIYMHEKKSGDCWLNIWIILLTGSSASSINDYLYRSSKFYTIWWYQLILNFFARSFWMSVP